MFLRHLLYIAFVCTSHVMFIYNGGIRQVTFFLRPIYLIITNLYQSTHNLTTLGTFTVVIGDYDVINDNNFFFIDNIATMKHTNKQRSQ